MFAENYFVVSIGQQFEESSIRQAGLEGKQEISVWDDISNDNGFLYLFQFLLVHIRFYLNR
mgnify:CR=1 FL=1